jgi:hypothetical protein
MQEATGIFKKLKPTSSGLNVRESEFLEYNISNIPLDYYIFKHDSPRYYRIHAELKRLEFNNDAHNA